jgi:hypothetical protein
MPLPHDLPSRAPDVVTIPVDTRRITGQLALTSCVVIAVGVVTEFVYDAADRRHDWWYRFVDVNGEGNLPSWISVLLLGGVALLLFAVARLRRRHGLDAPVEWALLGWFAVAMSLDEMTSIHEAVGAQIDERMWLPVIAGYGWILPGAAVAAGGAFVGWRALRSLPRHTRRALVAGAAVFVTGALALEVVEAILTDETGRFGAGPKLVTGAQELLEMLGTVMVLRVLLQEARRLSARAGDRTDDPAAAPVHASATDCAGASAPAPAA